MDKRMMLAWLQGQAQKQELTTTKMQQKRLGIFEQTGVPDSEKPGTVGKKVAKPKNTIWPNSSNENDFIMRSKPSEERITLTPEARERIRRLGINLDEGLRTTVNPETGEVDTGLLRRIAYGLSRATGLNTVKPMSGRNWSKVEDIKGEIERDKQNHEEATHRHMEDKMERGVAASTASRQHSEALAKWEVDREKFGRVRDLPNFHEFMKDHMGRYDQIEAQGEVRVHPTSGGWYGRGDHEAAGEKEWHAMRDNNIAARHWVKNNPRPVAPAPPPPGPSEPYLSPRTFAGPDSYPTSIKDINRQQSEKRLGLEQITETIRRIQESQKPNSQTGMNTAGQSVVVKPGQRVSNDGYIVRDDREMIHVPTGEYDMKTGRLKPERLGTVQPDPRITKPSLGDKYYGSKTHLPHHGGVGEIYEQKKNSIDLLLEYDMKGTLTHDEHGNPLSAKRAEQRALRLGQILKLALGTAMKMDGPNKYTSHDRDESLAFTQNDQLNRAIASLKAKGVIGVDDRSGIFDVSSRSHDRFMHDDYSPYEARVRAQGKPPEYPSPEWETAVAHRLAHALQFASPQTPDLKQNADEKQKSLSLKRRTDATNYKAELEREKADWNAGLERARKEEEEEERERAKAASRSRGGNRDERRRSGHGGLGMRFGIF